MNNNNNVNNNMNNMNNMNNNNNTQYIRYNTLNYNKNSDIIWIQSLVNYVAYMTYGT